MDTYDEALLMTVKRVAHALGVTPEVVRRWVRDGHLRHVRYTPRSPILIPREEVERLRTPKKT